MAKSPLNVSKVVETWREMLTATGRSAGIVLGGDEGLVALARQRLSDGGIPPALWTRPLSELTGLSSVPGELLVLLVPAGGEVEAVAALAQAAPRGGAVLAVDEGATASGKISALNTGCMRLSFADTPSGWRRLFESCAEVAGDHVVALGRRYPALRSAAARRVVYRAAAQNALIGLAFFVPGADLPAMMLSQIRMVLSIAGIYGQEIGRERAVELAGVVGMGFGLRALARLFLRSTPGIGWAIKASTGYSGTVAMGLAAVKYFEKGAPAATSRVVAFAGSLRR